MTMHLVGPHMTTTNYKKSKKKTLTQSQLVQLEIDWKQHNKNMRRNHMHDLQFTCFTDYVDYVQGTYKPKEPSKLLCNTSKTTERFRRETPYIPSLGHGIGNAVVKQRQVYTGTLVKGIAQTHKSNAVPVINDEEIINIRHMRR